MAGFLFLERTAKENELLKLHPEQRADVFGAYGVCVNEACDRCTETAGAKFGWTRKDRPETYCSLQCRGNKVSMPVIEGRCDHCG